MKIAFHSRHTALAAESASAVPANQEGRAAGALRPGEQNRFFQSVKLALEVNRLVAGEQTRDHLQPLV
jgi:hypothetical protein